MEGKNDGLVRGPLVVTRLPLSRDRVAGVPEVLGIPGFRFHRNDRKGDFVDYFQSIKDKETETEYKSNPLSRKHERGESTKEKVGFWHLALFEI